MAHLRRPELIAYILIVALGAGLLYWQRERIQNLVDPSDEPEVEAPSTKEPGGSPEGVDASGGNSPSGQPSPGAPGAPGPQGSPGPPGTPGGAGSSIGVDLPVPVEVCTPLGGVNCP